MITLVVLFGWMVAIGVAGWHPVRSARRGRWLALVLIGAAMAVSPFWVEVASGLLGSEPPRLAGPESAYACVWVLVLLPILRRQLDARALGATVLSGLSAAAAFGLAEDSRPLVVAALPAAESLLAPVVIVILALAGLALRLGMRPERFPWDYPAWYLAFAMMSEAAG